MTDSNETPVTTSDAPQAETAPAATATTSPAPSSNKKTLILVIIVLAVCSVISFVIGLLVSASGLFFIGSSVKEPVDVNPTIDDIFPQGTGAPIDSGSTGLRTDFASETVFIDVTDLDMFTEMVLQFEVQSKSGEALYISPEIIFNADTDLNVDSEGNAEIEYTVPAFSYSSEDAPLKLVMFELTPDSDGTVTKNELTSVDL